MTAPDPRLDEIQARVDECRPCGTDCGSTECQAERDAKYLLAELRKAREALERVEWLAAKIDKAFNTDHSVDVQMRATAYQLRAAVAAAKETE